MIVLAGWIVVALGAGVLLHETAHYVVADALNRDPRVRYPTIHTPSVLLSVSFEVADNTRDTFVALAPQAAALPPLIAVALIYAVAGELHFPALALALACGKPSPSDIAVARQTYCDVASCNKDDVTHSETKKSH